VFQGISEPVSVITPVGQQPVRLWKAAQQGRRSGVVADLTCAHEEADRTPIGIGDGVQLGVHAALGPADQTASLVAYGTDAVRPACEVIMQALLRKNIRLLMVKRFLICVKEDQNKRW
jgi:hypothetical protein